MTADDVLYRYRPRALALAEELGNVRAACRPWGSTTRPSTAGAGSPGATAWSCCACASGGRRRCPTKQAR